MTEQEIKEIVNGKKETKETKWESIKWEIEWYYNDWYGSIVSVIRGIRNFWTFRSEIYRYRWYDHSFLHNTIRARLNFMADNWHKSHYVDSELDEKELRELVAMLDLIDELEENLTVESDKEIDVIYHEFGRRLFGLTDYPYVDEKGNTRVKTHSAFRKFWD